MTVKLKNVSTDSLTPQLKFELLILDTDAPYISHEEHLVYPDVNEDIMQAALRYLRLFVQEKAVDQIIFDTQKVDLTRELQILWKKNEN